jgi:membrane-bound lytic murein transglycosylase D
MAALGGVVWLLVAWGQGIPTAAGASPHFPLPKALEPNVAFWIKVFAEVDSRGGLLHDPEDLRIIYHTFSELPPDRGERDDIIEQFRAYYMGILATLAEGKRQGLTLEEQRIFALFAGKQHAGAFWEAAGRMRFQGGVSSRFADSIVRSWSYLPIMERIFAAEGVPLELTLLPHIESSFLNAAVSHVGAAGLWQFMPATGRRFMTVSRDVDDRLNVERATTAAARLLQENYDYLGTWPLAITAYNHGANGMQRAVDAMGTTDIDVIVHNYKGPAFGFASRNFYVEFLAAVEVATNYQRYFPHLAPYAPRSPSFVTTPVVARSVQQPSWGPQSKLLPQIAARQNIMERQPYRMPKSTLPPQIIARQEIAERRVYQTARNEPAQRSTMASETIDRRPYLVQSGETLTQIATRHDTTPATLVTLNDLPWPYTVQTGQLIVVPVIAAMPQSTLSQRVAETPAPQPARPSSTAEVPPAPVRPVRQDAEQALIQSQRLQTGSVVATVPSPQRRAVAEPTPTQPEQSAVPAVASLPYQVKRGETLAQIAARHDTTVTQLIVLNKLRKPYRVTTGQQLVLPAAPAPQADQKLAVARATPTPPAQKAAEAAPTQSEPLDSSQRYQVKRGETLTQIAARHDTTVTQLIALNKLRKPYQVTTGQQLVLPAAPAAKTAPAPAIAQATVTVPTPAEASRPYQVKRGETLAQIAARHQTTADTLITLNKLRKPYKVIAGQKLVLPSVVATPASKAQPLAAAQHYQVKRGETLAQVAARHDTTIAQLISLNKLRKPYTITTGQQLVLPAAPAAQPAPAPAVAEATVTAPVPAEASRPYQVKRGETLAQIAARHQTTANTLITMNKLRKPYKVTAGQKLVLPSAVATPASKARPQAVVQKRYRVRQGDTLATIADRFETTTANIITANELRRPYTIKPGQVLLLPQPSPEAAVPDEGGKRLWRRAAVGDARPYAIA